MVKQYNALMGKVQELNIEQLITQKLLIDVGRLVVVRLVLMAHRERTLHACSKRAYKTGPTTVVLLQRCFVWQLDHSTGTKEECETWLLDNWKKIVDETTDEKIISFDSNTKRQIMLRCLGQRHTRLNS